MLVLIPASLKTDVAVEVSPGAQVESCYFPRTTADLTAPR